MRVHKPPGRRSNLKKLQISFKSDPNPSKYGNIDGFEIDEALFSLLDGLVETNEKTKEVVVKTLMKFALYQPDLVLKSILTFLQVQKTTVTHQHSLLAFLKKCITELKNVPNTTVKEVLLFVLKEIRFLKVTDQRHLEMKEIINAATVLCPSFSVDIILASIKDINQRENYFEILCIYVKVLTHICVSVPSNSYVKSVLISSHLMSLYNKDVFKEENQEICKELSSLLYAISNMILTVPYAPNSYARFIGLVRFSSMNNNTFGKVCSEVNGDSTICEALNLENNVYDRFLTQSNLTNNTHDTVNSVNSLNGVNNVNHVDSKMIRKMSRPNIEDIKNILEPLYGLMLDYFLQKIYINPAYDNTCLELLYSLVIISEYVSPECFRNNSLNLLTCIIVRFLNYVPNLKLNDNLWLKLHKIGSNNLTNKFVSLFSNPNVLGNVPPKFFVYGLRVFLQILYNNNQFYIYTNSHNLCNILFSILVTLYNSSNKYLLSYLKDSVSFKDNSVVTSPFSSTDSVNEIDNVYIDHIINSLRILFSINSTCLVLCEFLYNKLTSNVLSSVILSFYVFSCTFTVGTNTKNDQENSFSLKNNCLVDTSESYNIIKSNNHEFGEKRSILMYKIIDNIKNILKITVTDTYSFYIIVQFINNLFSSKYISFYSNYNHLEQNNGLNKKLKSVYYIIDYVFEYKINMVIKKRIESNLELLSDNKFDQTFFNLMYHYDPNSSSQLLTTHPSAQIEFIEECIDNMIKNSPEHFLSYLMNKLTSNIKRNLLTIFIYFDKLFERCEEDLIRKVLGEENLLMLLILSMIYLHDPVYYFGEAYYCSKLLIKLYKLLFVPVGYKDVSLSKLLIDESVVVNDLGDYNTLDYFCVKDNEVKVVSRIDENYVYPTDIVINMMNVSRIIEKLNGFYKVDGAKIINQMSSVIKKLKNKPVLHRSTSFLFTSSFLTTGNTFSTNIILSNSLNTTTSILKVNGIVIDTDLSVFQNLGILNIICIFSINTTHKSIYLDNGVTDIINSVVNNVSTNASTFTLGKEELTLAQKQKLTHIQHDIVKIGGDGVFWCNSMEMKYIYLMLNSICISNLANTDNTRVLCTKLYQIMVQNIPKDSSFSLFGKTSAYLQSERVRLTLLSALTHVYAKFGPFLNNKEGDDVELRNGKESVEELLSSRYNKISNLLLAKEKSNESDDNSISESMVEKYIISPMILMFNNETESSVQEFILNRLILLTHSNRCVNGDIEMISVLFNKLIGIILKFSDSNLKLDPNSLFERYEKNEILNINDVNREVNEKEQLLSFYSFVLLSSFGPHYKSLTRSEKPYMVLYYILYWCDYYFYANVAKFYLNYSFCYNFHSAVNQVKIVQFYLKTVFDVLNDSDNSVDWNILYKIVAIILSNNNQIEPLLIKNRLYIMITFLNEVSHYGYTELSKEDSIENWLKILMMIWCYVLKCHDFNVKINLISIFYRLFKQHKSAANTEALVKLDATNNLDTIITVMPEDLRIKLVMLAVNYLERPTCISNSLIKIIHKILKQNMNLMSTQQIQSVLIAVFSRFKQHLQSNNIPIFLRLFLTDIFRSNFKILFNILFGYNLEFQSNVMLMIIRDEELLDLLLDYLQQFIDKQLQECFQLDSGISGNAEDVENSSVSNRELSKEHSIKTLECIIEYNVNIFKNNFELLNENSDYVNLLIIYVNAMSNRVSGLIKENLDKKITRLLKSILQQDVSTNNTILHYSIGIIGSNSKLLNAFLDYVLNLFDSKKKCSKNSNDVADLEFDGMKVLLKIIIELIKCKLLIGYDLKVIKIIKSLGYNYKLIYYYLKNIYITKINPYYNLYNDLYSRVQKVRKRFFDQLITSLNSSIDEKIETNSLYYYMKVIHMVIRIITNNRLENYYDNVNKMICTIVRNKTFFNRKKLRHSYLQLYCSILQYITVKNTVSPRVKIYKPRGTDNLKTHLLYPTCVAIMSKDGKGLSKICNKYMKLFISLFFGNCYTVDCSNLFEEVIRALIVMGNSNSTCICNSTNQTLGNTCTIKYSSEPSQKTLCVCKSFYLLYILSYFIPNNDDEGILVPVSINEEFKNIKRLQLDKKSSEVLFQSKPTFENHSQEFIDVNEFYNLNLNLGNSSTHLDNTSDLSNISVCGDLLVLLDVSDYVVVDGRAKSNFMYNSDSLEEYFTKVSGKNLSLLRLESVDVIKNSFLFLSNNVYRFITFQRYLNSKPIKVNLFQSDTYFSFNSTLNKHNEVVNNKTNDKVKEKPTVDVIQDDVLYNCVKFCVFIMSKSSLYISENSEFLQLDHQFNQKDEHELEANLKLIRRNCLIHYESLCNVVLSKLCKLINNTKFKLYIYKQLQHLSNVVSH